MYSISEEIKNGMDATGKTPPVPASCASIRLSNNSGGFNPVQSFSYTIPVTGYYTFALWGAGGTGDAYSGDGSVTTHFSGGSGSLAVKKSVLLSAGQVLTGQIGWGGGKFASTDTYINFPTGQVKAGGASGRSPGTATGGDFNVPGSPGAYTDGVTTTQAAAGSSQVGPGGASGGTGMAGAGAPGFGIQPGGKGGTPDRGTTVTATGQCPGGGGSQMYPYPDQQVATGGDGMILVFVG